MAIYYHGLPLGAAKLAVESGELLSPEEQWKKEMNWNNLSPTEKESRMQFLAKSLDKSIETEEDLFRAINTFSDHEYESRFQNLTFTKSLDQALVYAVRRSPQGVILGLEFTDNGQKWIKTPKKSLTDLKQVFLTPEAVKLEQQVKQLFNGYAGIEWYQLKYQS